MRRGDRAGIEIVSQRQRTPHGGTVAPVSRSVGPSAPDLEGLAAVSWDVDGTLYSTRSLPWRLLLAIATASFRDKSLGGARNLGQLRRHRRRVEVARTGGGCWSPSEADIAARLALEDRWLLPAIARIGVRAGVADLLGFFRRHGLKQVVVSDFVADRKLANLGLAGQFDAVYAGERLGSIKPSPKLLQEVLRDLDIPPDRLLHIGDRPDTDGAAAKEAHCRVLLLGRDFGSFRQLFRTLAGTSRFQEPR